MADVVFFGIGAVGFPDPNVKFLPGAPPAQTDATFSPGVVPPPAVNTFVEFGADPAEHAEVEFTEGIVPVAASLQPNFNDILVVVGSVTGGAFPDVIINVLLVPAVVPLSDGTIIQPSYVADDLRLFAGPTTPLGVVGKTITFIQPTGADTFAPIRGQTAVIASLANPTGPMGTETGTAVAFTTPLGVAPTNGDRFLITSDNRTLRRTPILEVILG